MTYFKTVFILDATFAAFSATSRNTRVIMLLFSRYLLFLRYSANFFYSITRKLVLFCKMFAILFVIITFAIMLSIQSKCFNERDPFNHLVQK